MSELNLKCPADFNHNCPGDWDDDYKSIWVQLQVQQHNKMQYRKAWKEVQSELTAARDEGERLRGRCGEAEARLNQINNLVALRWSNGVPTNSEMIEEVEHLSKLGAKSAQCLRQQADEAEKAGGDQ